MISKQENITKHHDFWGWFFFEFCSCVSKSICCLIVFWLQFLAMSTPRPDVVLSRPHVHNTTMSHDAEVLRNPTHKIPPEFARVLSRSYQRYLSENMKMCVSYRVWGQLLFKVEGFISFAWFRICFRKKSDANWTHQGEVPRYYFSEQKLIQGSRHLRPLREEAGRSWEKLRTWKRYAPVPFVCPHHLGQPVHSYKSSAPSSANTFLDAFSTKKKKKFLDPIFPDIFYWILNLLTVGLPQTFSLVTSSLENPRSKKLLKSRPRATREFSQDVSPKKCVLQNLPKWLKMRKLQREAASEKSASPWISGASLCDFVGVGFLFAAGRQPWCQKSAPLLSNKTTGSRSLNEAIYYPWSNTFTEIPWD